MVLEIGHKLVKKCLLGMGLKLDLESNVVKGIKLSSLDGIII